MLSKSHSKCGTSYRKATLENHFFTILHLFKIEKCYQNHTQNVEHPTERQPRDIYVQLQILQSRQWHYADQSECIFTVHGIKLMSQQMEKIIL
jgi:hypothetical protein